ncbi:unnamed protein product [Linum trigynum]|uniref:Uncharacterized protein n=1 Tax=Linum trigynum TaxID=586398 RepID=A0AAV2G786_9ROSI
MLKRIEENGRVIEKLCSRLSQERLFDIKNETKEEAVKEEGVSRVDKQVELEDLLNNLLVKPSLLLNIKKGKLKKEALIRL